MTTFEVGTGSGGVLQLLITEVSTDAAANTSRVRFQANIFTPDGSYHNDPNITVSVTGNVQSWSITNWSFTTAGWHLLYDQTVTVTHNPDGSASVYATMSMGATGTSGVGGPSEVSGSIDLTTLVAVPGVPTGVAGTRVSDTQIDLAWTNHYPSNGVPTATDVQVSVDDAAFAVQATLGNVSSASVTAASNQKRVYQVRQRNGAGASAWSASSAPVYTTPAAPTGVSVARTSDTSHTISWTNPAKWADTVVVQRQVDGGAWADLVTTLAGTATSYVDATTSANHSYSWRVQTKRGSLASAYATSAVTYTTPAAPTGAVLTRTSDTSHTVTWANHGAYTATNAVERQTDGGSWVTLTTTLAATATSYTDTSTVANHRYAYRVRAIKGALSSAYATTGTLATTPAAPTNVAATKSGANIVVTWTDNATSETGFTIQRSQDGGASGSDATVGAGVTTWTHSAPAAGSTWRYQVKATTTTPALSSAYAQSNTVQLAAPPNAPTGLGPAAVQVAGAASYAVSWHHNPVDSSTQVKRQIRHRVVGDSAWVEDAAVASSAQSGTIALSPSWSGQTEWQVRTWGVATTGGSDGTGASPYSATAVLSTNFPPTATVNVPANGSTVTTSMITVTWGYYDAEASAQAAWMVKLVQSGAALETQSGTGAATSTTLASTLADGATYQVQVQVRDGAGLWSTADASEFTVAYALPPTPTLVASWNPDSATVAVQIINPAPGSGEVATDHNDLYRSIDSGPFELIATGVPVNTIVTDWSPTVAGTNTYRAAAVSALPSSVSSSDMGLVTSSDSVWISGGPGFAQVCRARYDLVIDNSGGLADKVLQQFAGRDEPVEFAGTATTRKLSLEATIPPGRSDVAGDEDWIALAELPGPHLWRDPTGRRVVVSISQVDVPRAIGGVVTLNLNATRIADA